MKTLSATLILAGAMAATSAWAFQTTSQTTTPTTAAAPTTSAATTAKPKATVIVGSITCFVIRECALGQTPQQRSDQIMDVFNKYLGGSKATFAVKPSGKNTVITMNKERLIVVTPQDAKTAKAKNVAQLTTQWKTRLSKAFDDTKAIK